MELLHWLFAAVVLGANLYNYRFLDGAGMYNNIMSWQLTIFSLHVAPIVTIRCFGLLRRTELLLCTCWILLAWLFRRGQRSLFSLFFIFLEGLVAMCILEPPLLDALMVLQALISFGFWGGVVFASASPDFSFLPLDRHLRLGWRHMLASRKAQRCLLHEFVGHFVSQASFAAVLLLHLGRCPPLAVALPGVLLLVASYLACVVAASAAVPPHELPYNLGALPSVLRRPLPLPPWLVGGGASGGLEALTLPWWMQGIDGGEEGGDGGGGGGKRCANKHE
mmetsp:Transcript_99760/g.267890  ORF Transcript_99760/g.267890 Transcript_99760/m.267890 type:complete len:279 (-) Transcript_99760:49-885(-)